ncbi:hypothetical protein [Nonomuraea sp. NPDC050786]|uniref:hypothetical protein n=1 Tax=Nonomuraea sp. NPDC050786 TaxID=3154840 RepID=UPI0033ED3C10
MNRTGDMELLGWMDVDTRSRAPLEAIGTLGPVGTSSETAAAMLWRVAEAPGDPRIDLYDTYEEAAQALLDGKVTHFVVANAYRCVNEFYMDTRMALGGAFIMDTPLYGLAKSRGHDTVPAEPTIATHPAPAPLIAQLLPPNYTPGKVMIMSSTSAAAMAVSCGTIDLALTTAPSVETYDLEFISRTRPIRMVWSVFVASD